MLISLSSFWNSSLYLSSNRASFIPSKKSCLGEPGRCRQLPRIGIIVDPCTATSEGSFIVAEPGLAVGAGSPAIKRSSAPMPWAGLLLPAAIGGFPLVSGLSVVWTASLIVEDALDPADPSSTIKSSIEIFTCVLRARY